MKKLIITVLHTAGKWIFWSYDRKSWQYDLLCLILILALIFIPVKGPQSDKLKSKDASTISSTLSINITSEANYLFAIIEKYFPFIYKNKQGSFNPAFIEIIKANKIFQGFSSFL